MAMTAAAADPQMAAMLIYVTAAAAAAAAADSFHIVEVNWAICHGDPSKLGALAKIRRCLRRLRSQLN